MKLIDADKLIETVNKYAQKIQFEHLVDWLTFLEIIDEQPTAFDVDKVVAQLEELDNAEVDYYTSNDVIDREEAIEIVKAGEIDES